MPCLVRAKTSRKGAWDGVEKRVTWATLLGEEEKTSNFADTQVASVRLFYALRKPLNELLLVGRCDGAGLKPRLEFTVREPRH